MTALAICAAFGTVCSPAQVAVVSELLEVSIEEKQDPVLVAAVAWHESRWHADRISKCGARGPLGVLPVWLRRPACAGRGLVDCGVRLLVLGGEQCGRRADALGWYHTGRCVVDRYARAVLATYRRAQRWLARKAVT